MKHLLLIAILCPIHPDLAISGTAAIPIPQAAAATTPPPPTTPFAGLIAEYLRRDANGHSPNADEISAMESLQPAPDAASIAEAMPWLLKALDNPDIPLHTFALTAIAGLQTAAPIPPGAPSQTAPASEPGATTTPAPLSPPAYKPDVAKVLTPYIAQIATHLTTEESAQNRLLTTTILGGFTPNPPAAIYPPLLAFLKRDDAIGPVGQSAVSDLLQLGPITDDTAAAIARYLRRADQTSDSRANLADMIAGKPNQSQAVNKSLLLYLDSDDQSLRARVILSLPQLDLAPDVFADTKSRIDQIASNPNENLQVVTAAKSIATCWTTPKMTTNCPVY
jgi:hypothetical protein